MFTSSARVPVVAHDPPSMRFDCDLADAELISNLFVQETRHHQRENLALTVAERGEASLESPRLGLLLENGAASLERVADGSHQPTVAHRRLH